MASYSPRGKYSPSGELVEKFPEKSLQLAVGFCTFLPGIPEQNLHIG
jgi:hypothetical protein